MPDPESQGLRVAKILCRAVLDHSQIMVRGLTVDCLGVVQYSNYTALQFSPTLNDMKL